MGPEGRFHACRRVPGDKSLSHRVLLLAGMAEGESVLTGLGPGDDVAATRRLLEALGAEVAGERVSSPGVAEWTAPSAPFDAGNSATTVRLGAGAVAGRPFRTTLVGDPSLMRRPMRRLVGPLGDLGARVEVTDEGTAPVVVEGGPLRGAQIDLPQASAQVRSAVELAALQAEGRTIVDAPPGFRDHTERLLVSLERGAWISQTAFAVEPGPIKPFRYQVPGDLSSAAFLLAAAALVPGSRMEVEGTGLNPGRAGFLEVLERMGAVVEWQVEGEVAGEPVGRVVVEGASLSGVELAGELAVRSADEIPLIAVLAGRAVGVTTVADSAELRVKESDRIAGIVSMLRGLGVGVEETPEGFVVEGHGRPYRGGLVRAGGDHRLAMAAAVAAAGATGDVVIDGAEVARISWPGFYAELEGAWSSP